jgi:hypothetical protein
MPRSLALLSASELSYRDLSLAVFITNIAESDFRYTQGILMSYSASFAERGRVIANYVDQILKGAKPADLPVQQPTRYELAIYLAARGLFFVAPLHFTANVRDHVGARGF